MNLFDLDNSLRGPKKSIAESQLDEFAPGGGGGESGRWYTDDQMTDIVGDGWWNDLDVSGDISKQEMIQEAQAWLNDQGYNVQVLNCKLNDDDMEWYIEGSFINPNFAKKGMAEAYQFKGPFPFDVDHMHGGRGINLPKAETKKYFTDKKQWERAVNNINSSKYDDNSDYIGVTGRSTVEINGREWARWSDAQQKGYIELSSMSEQGMAEGHKVVPDIDRERYTDLGHEGLEGPFRLKSGKVVYYDKKAGRYYDRDTDMYLSHDDYDAHNKDVREGAATDSAIKIPTEDGITMQDIRLMAGEGKLTRKTVLQAITVIRKQRRQQGVAEGAGQFTSRQEVINYFVGKGKSMAAGASAWERGWRGPTPKKRAPTGPVRSYHDKLDDKRYGEVEEARGDDEKIAGRYDPEDFDAMVQRVGQKAKEQQRRHPVDIADLARRMRDLDQRNPSNSK